MSRFVKYQTVYNSKVVFDKIATSFASPLHVGMMAPCRRFHSSAYSHHVVTVVLSFAVENCGRHCVSDDSRLSRASKLLWESALPDSDKLLPSFGDTDPEVRYLGFCCLCI